MRDRLSDMIQDAVGGCAKNWADIIADHLLSEGVIVPPAFVGQMVYCFCPELGGVFPYFVETIHIGFMDKEKNYWTFEANCHDEETDELLDEIDFDLDDIGKTVFLTREEAEKALALAGRMKLLKPEKWQRIPLSECHLYECCCNCTEFSCSGMSAPDGYCREHSKDTNATKHCKKFKERT